MAVINMINKYISIIFTVCYLYQFVYILIPLFARRRRAGIVHATHRYAVLISARNEERVIGELIADLGRQTYPSKLITVFVVADNCTDGTAQAALRAGAVVFERFDLSRVGKGYALDFLLDRIGETYDSDMFDGFFVFDADNLLDENFISEMNRLFSRGHKIITSYRNSKNYAANWISAGYSLWFLRESQYLNNSRMLLGTSCAISGTGFLVSREILEKNGGWKFFLLTEDIEFSVHSVISGERIAFCETAILYDEQPVTFRQSWRQRMRWAKGFLQVFRKYGARLLSTIATKRSFACFDMTMTVMPAVVLTGFSLLCNIGMAIAGLVLERDVTVVISSMLETFFFAYIMLFAVGTITVITEWRKIHCKPFFKIAYLFTFPLFMFTYIPIAATAMLRKVEWKPIAHTDVKTLREVRALDAIDS